MHGNYGKPVHANINVDNDIQYDVLEYICMFQETLRIKIQVLMLYQWNNMTKTTSGQMLVLKQDHQSGTGSN